MKSLPLIACLLLSNVVLRAESAAPAQSLFDASLSQWDEFMGVPHGSLGLPGVPAESDGMKGQPLGLNNDPLHVFTVMMEGGEPVLHISGQMYGGLTSKAEFSNYHLRVQFKWGEKKWAPRLDQPRDNGILYHCTGPHGVFWNVWKRSLEFQVQEKDMGDYYGLGGTVTEMAVALDGKRWYYTPGAELKKFRRGAGYPGTSAAHLKGDFEKPNGEWNTLEIYTLGRDSVHVVNGHVVHVLRHNAYLAGDKDADEVPLTAGQIQIQSEGAEAFYRRLEIQPITEFPGDIRTAAGL